ncbi:MAG TPA: hypothetical protein DEG42_03155, partial [Acholeplasmataceae bacterium]|nr:hypothetical protein [Acholeplasmataceae bacterium]
MTVYAKWAININVLEYTITFDSMGGTAVDPIQAEYQESIQQPANPTKDGFFVFEGWYLDDDYTLPYTFTTMPENDFTLYAKWANTLELTTDPISITLWHAEKTSSRTLL